MSKTTDFQRAIELMGGVRAASRRTNITRGRLEYWLHNGWPYWANADADKVIELARDPANHKHPEATRWATLTYMRQRQSEEES